MTPSDDETPPVYERNNEVLNERQRAFRRYKQAVKTHGKPFFPYGTWHDSVAVLGVVILLLALTVGWYGSAACGDFFNPFCDEVQSVHEQEKRAEGGTKVLGIFNTELPFGPLYEEKADPATTEYDPRPEWYFYFLFQLLRIFSAPDLVILGTIGIPTIALVILLAWPFIDRKRERRPSRRPLAMAGMVVTAIVLFSFTNSGLQAGHTGTLENAGLEPEGVTEMAGAALTLGEGAPCLSCHVVGTLGKQSVGAPDLTEEGTKNRGLEWQIDHLKDPQSRVPGSGMPPMGGGDFTDEEVTLIAEFLESLGNQQNFDKYSTEGASADAGPIESEEVGAEPGEADESKSGVAESDTTSTDEGSH